MLSYKQQYQSLAGIFYAFSNNSSTRVLSVMHSSEKIQKMKIFSNSRYDTTTKQDFILICLWYIYKHNVTSLHDMMVGVYSLDKETLKGFIDFKHKIVNYSMYLSRDIESIQNKYGGLTDFQSIMHLYRHDSINWYTMYYCGLYSGINFDAIKKSRRFGKLIKKTEVLVLYIVFNEKSLQNIKNKILNMKESL